MAAGEIKALAFVAAMLAGMLVYELAERYWHQPRAAG
jgi:hypothetical protein